MFFLQGGPRKETLLGIWLNLPLHNLIHIGPTIHFIKSKNIMFWFINLLWKP